MEIDVRMENDSLSILVDNPFKLELDAIVREIEHFVSSKGAAPDGLDIRGLIPKMVRGVAGCEEGCPANAQQFVENGFRNFSLVYIEGGILSAKAFTGDGKELSIKMFPDF